MYGWWEQEQWEIENLKNQIRWTFSTERKKKLIETLASYKRSAVPALIELSNVPMSKETGDLILDKIKEINEGKIL